MAMLFGAVLADLSAKDPLPGTRWLITLIMLFFVVGFVGRMAADQLYRSLVRGIYIGVIPTSALVLYQWHTSPIARRFGIYDLTSAPHGLLPYYTVSAGLIGVGAITAWVSAITSYGAKRAFHVLVLGFTGLALFATPSRGALAAAGVGLMVVLLGHRGWSIAQRLSAFAAVGTAAVGSLLLFFPTLVERLAGSGTGSALSDARRAVYQEVGFHEAIHHPLGIGYGNFAKTALFPLGLVIPLASHAHNLFIQVSLDIGVIGLAGFLCLAASALLRMFRNTSSFAPSRIALLSAGISAMLLSQGLNDYHYYYSGAWIAHLILITASGRETAAALSSNPVDE